MESNIKVNTKIKPEYKTKLGKDYAAFIDNLKAVNRYENYHINHLNECKTFGLFLLDAFIWEESLEAKKYKDEVIGRIKGAKHWCEISKR